MAETWKNRLARRIDERGTNMREVSVNAGLGETAVRDWLKRDRSPSVEGLSAVAKGLGTTVGWIIGEKDSTPTGDQQASITIPEYDVRVSAGDGFHIAEETQKDAWPFSRAYIEGELRLPLHQLVILEVIGDSMVPTLHSGDRVLVNMADTRISQPGVFVLWDGDGTVVKRLEMIPGSEPAKLRRISDNPLHGDYEVLAEDTNIIGRVVWFARRT